MNITFVSADDTIRMTFGIDPWSAVTDLTKIEKELGKDLTDIIQKAVDVAFNVTSQTFTRGPKDAYIVSYSWEMQPIIGGSITKDNAVKSISVNVGDSDHNLYEFEDVEDRDIDAMITWLRKEHNVYYTPNDELLNEKKKWATKVAEQQKKIDSYEDTLSKITDIMKPKDAGLAWSETWDDLVERIKRMKEHAEKLETVKNDWKDSFVKAQDSRSAFCKKLKEALNVDYRYPGSFPKMEEDILAEIARLKKEAAANDFYVESEWEADYRAFVQRIFEAVGTPCIDEVIHTNYLAAQALEAVKGLKAEHDDARGLSLKIEELEEKLKHAAGVEVWYRRTNRELVMERDRYRDLYEDLERSSAVDIDDLNEWRSALGNLYEDVTNVAPDFDSPPTLLTKRIYKVYKHARDTGAKYCDRMRRLEQKLEDIKDICDGNSDVMNIIGE